MELLVLHGPQWCHRYADYSLCKIKFHHLIFALSHLKCIKKKSAIPFSFVFFLPQYALGYCSLYDDRSFEQKRIQCIFHLCSNTWRNPDSNWACCSSVCDNDIKGCPLFNFIYVVLSYNLKVSDTFDRSGGFLFSHDIFCDIYGHTFRGCSSGRHSHSCSFSYFPLCFSFISI